MSSKNLILKQRHWKYTVGAVLAVLPVVITLTAAAAAWVSNVPIAERVLDFLTKQHVVVLSVLWLVLPLASFNLAHAAYKRGTIDRWRPINKATKTIAIISLIAILSLAFLG